jgi:predicted ATP-grasp superfamily ATP-dependent carboligase
MGLGPGGLGVLRSLARLGVEVHGVYAYRGDVGRHSRALRGRHLVVDRGNGSEVMTTLRRIRRHVSPGERMVLFPTNDTYALFVSERRSELEEDFLFRVPPASIKATFLDKRATVGVCLRHGIPIPRSCVPASPADVEQGAKDFGFPVIIKPALQDDAGFPGKNVVAASADELLAFYDGRPDLVERTMFQEVIPSGDGHIVGINTYSGADGRVLAWTSHRRLRQWLPDRGASCYAVSETLTSLQEPTIRFLDDLGYVGFAGVEYAEDVATGQRFFLELNARVVLPNRLFADSGVDLTAIGYLEMCGQPTPRDLVQRDGVYWMDFQRDLLSSFVTWRRGRLGLFEWLGGLRRTTSHATFDLRDPKPFVASLASLASAALGRSSGRQLGSRRAFTDLFRSR